jgi:prevent-host-death family protein
MYNERYIWRCHPVKIPDIVPVSDMRRDVAAVLRRLPSASGPLVITQRGRAVAVLQTIEAFEKSERERDLLRLLATGEREIARGEGHTLAQVLKEADALLRDLEH